MRLGRECIDDWLAHRNLWRKQVARDDMSLYRAICDQLFPLDGCPERMRNQVDSYIRVNAEKLKSHLACRVEYLAVCNLFNCSIVIFRYNKSPVEVSFEDAERKVLLCVNSSQQYDPVYPLDRREQSAICQSIVYEILYKNVFHVPDETLDLGLDVLRAKVSKRAKMNLVQRVRTTSESGEDEMIRTEDGRLLPSHPPFPYRVAKSLDATVYRNVQFDLWIDQMKESRDAPVFCVGDRCKVALNSGLYNAHIQDVKPNAGPVQVFIQEFGERLDVPYDSLRAIPKVQQTNRHNKRRGWSLSHLSPERLFGGIPPSRPEAEPIYSLTMYKGKPRRFLNATGQPIRVKCSQPRRSDNYCRKSDYVCRESPPSSTPRAVSAPPLYQENVVCPTSTDEMMKYTNNESDDEKLTCGIEPGSFTTCDQVPNTCAYTWHTGFNMLPMFEQFQMARGPEMDESYISNVYDVNVTPDMMQENLLDHFSHLPTLAEPSSYCCFPTNTVYYPTPPPTPVFVWMPPSPVEYNPYIPPPMVQGVYLPPDAVTGPCYY